MSAWGLGFVRDPREVEKSVVALATSKTPISRGALFRLMLGRKTVCASFLLLDETKSILYRDLEEFLTFVEKMSSLTAKCAGRQFHAHDG